MMKMMSVQLKIWKRLITNQHPLSSHHQLIFPLPTPILLPFISKPHITFPNFCSQTATPSTTPPEKGVASEFFLNKCGLSEKDIASAFRQCNNFLLAKSTQNLEEVLELINGYGLTTSDQIRRVVLCNPKFFFYKAKKNVQSKLTLLKTIMVEEDISKLLITDTRLFDAGEDNLKSVIPLLQGLGFEGQVLSELVVTQPSLLMTTEEKIMELFKQAEDLGFKKGSKGFAYALRVIWGRGKHKLRQTLQFLSSLGFSEKQISELASRDPRFLELSEEKLKSTVDFMVKYVEDNLKSVIPLLQGLGFEGQVLSELVVTQPSLLTTIEEKIMELVKQAEDLGFKKGSKGFAYALRVIWGRGKHKLRRTLQFLSSLGFSEKQISELASRDPRFLELSEEKLKSTVDFMVMYVELSLADLVKYSHLWTYSLERRIIPRYRVMEALTSVQGQEKIPFVRIFYMTEKRFLKKYVDRNTKSSVLQTIYHCQKAGKFTTDK